MLDFIERNMDGNSLAANLMATVPYMPLSGLSVDQFWILEVQVYGKSQPSTAPQQFLNKNWQLFSDWVSREGLNIKETEQLLREIYTDDGFESIKN